jgi:hypothetical protein
VRGGGCGDDAGPEARRPLREYQANSARPGVHQNSVALLYRVHRVDEQVGGHALQDRCGGDVGADTVRHRRDDIDWRNTVVGVGADGVGGGHPLAQQLRRQPVANCFDGAAHLSAEDERQSVRIQPGTEVGVDEIHADRLGFD